MFCNVSEYVNKPSGRKQKLYTLKSISWNFSVFLSFNRPIQAKCVASVTNCRLGLETAMAPTLNRDCQLFTNGKYWKFFNKLFHIKWRLRLVFQLNDCVFPKDLTQYLSGYNPMIKRTDFSRLMT